MTLEHLVREFQHNWGGELDETHRHSHIFIVGRRRAGGRVEVLPVINLSATTVTENIKSHHFFLEGSHTALRPTPRGWKRHRGILLMPA